MMGKKKREVFEERAKDAWGLKSTFWKGWKGPRVNNIRMEA